MVSILSDPTTNLIAATAPKVKEALGTDSFVYPFSGSVIIDIEHKILTLKLKPSMFQGLENEDAYEFILDFYEQIHKFGIAHQHIVEFVTFQLQREAKWW